jgi:thiamine-phosphate pyrophosphorylase
MTLPPFYPILDTGLLRKKGLDPLEAARQILDAGAKILQFRHKDFWSAGDLNLLFAVAEAARRTGAMLVVNDRADFAKLANAALHLGQMDLPPHAARKVAGSSCTIGFSTHNERQLREAESEPVDYVALGPMFETASKENPGPVVGIAELRRLRPLSSRPLVAIGGIARCNAPSVLSAGADSVAVIGDLLPEDGNIRERTEEWLRLLR